MLPGPGQSVLFPLSLTYMKSLFLLIILMTSGALFAQDTDSLQRTQQPVSQPSEMIDLQSLTVQLIDSLEDEFLKMEAIYQFVITNISYDHEAYKGATRRINRNNKDILARRKAVCWGYAELVREMCKYAGIACQTIIGYTNRLPFPSRALEYANHAWNAVRLGDKWYLLDATWGSGTQFEKDYFTAVYGIDYYLTPPEWFIKNHFPLMPMWQLLDCPITLQEFQALQFDLQPSCHFDFQDSISAYLKLPLLEQKAKALMVAYDINKTHTNRRQLGHALVDIAIEKKERGDGLMEQDSQALAIEELEAALQIFQSSKMYCDFYPWQNEAYVFTALNLAQAYYSTFYKDPDKIDMIATQFRNAQSILDQTPLRTELKAQAQSMLQQYLNVLN